MWSAWRQKEIRGRVRVAATECYCLRLNVSKTKMMMPGDAGGGARWQCVPVSAASGAQSKVPT